MLLCTSVAVMLLLFPIAWSNWGDIVATTVDWYRAQATAPEASPRLAEATTLKVPA